MSTAIVEKITCYMTPSTFAQFLEWEKKVDILCGEVETVEFDMATQKEVKV